MSCLQGCILVYLAGCNAATVMTHYHRLKQKAASLAAWFVIAMPELSSECMQFADMEKLGQAEGLPPNCAVLHDFPATSSLLYHMIADISGCKAKFLFDSGAAINAISEDFCKRYGTSICPNPDTIAIRTVADAPEQTVVGQCKLKLRMQNFSSTVTCMVLPMRMDYDVLLGDPRLTAVNAQMFYDTENGCTAINVHQHGKQTTLALPNKAVKPSTGAADKPLGSVISVSAVQFKRQTRKNFFLPGAMHATL